MKDIQTQQELQLFTGQKDSMTASVGNAVYHGYSGDNYAILAHHLPFFKFKFTGWNLEKTKFCFISDPQGKDRIFFHTDPANKKLNKVYIDRPKISVVTRCKLEHYSLLFAQKITLYKMLTFLNQNCTLKKKLLNLCKNNFLCEEIKKFDQSLGDFSEKDLLLQLINDQKDQVIKNPLRQTL